jgi:hypothetical protein
MSDISAQSMADDLIKSFAEVPWDEVFGDTISGMLKGFTDDIGDTVTDLAAVAATAYNATKMGKSEASVSMGIAGAQAGGLPGAIAGIFGGQILGVDKQAEELNQLIQSMNQLKRSLDENTQQMQNELKADSPSEAEIKNATEGLVASIKDEFKNIFIGETSGNSELSVPLTGVEELESFDLSQLIELVNALAAPGIISGKLPGLPEQYYEEDYEGPSDVMKNRIKTTETALGLVQSAINNSITDLSLIAVNTGYALDSGLENIIGSLENVDLASRINAIKNFDGDLAGFDFQTTAFGKATQDFDEKFGTQEITGDDTTYGNITGPVPIKEYTSGLGQDIQTEIGQQEMFRSMLQNVEEGTGRAPCGRVD